MLDLSILALLFIGKKMSNVCSILFLSSPTTCSNEPTLTEFRHEMWPVMFYLLLVYFKIN